MIIVIFVIICTGSKFAIENAIERLEDSSQSLCLSGLELTSFYHAEFMVHLRAIDISNNNLAEINGLHYLQCIKTLIADSNVISLNKQDLKCLPNLVL